MSLRPAARTRVLHRAWVPVMGLAAVLTGCLQPPPPATAEPAAPVATNDAGAAVLWEGRGVGDLYAVGEVRQFEFKQGGQPLGRSWGRYVGPLPEDASLHLFETRIELLVPGRGTIRSSGELVLDAQGHLVRGLERSEAAELRYERKGDKIEITDGQQIDEVGYDPEAGDAVMAHTAILHEELMLGLREIVEGDQSWRLLSVSGGPPTQWEGKASPVRDGEASSMLLGTSLGETIRFKAGRIESIDVPSSGLEVRAAGEPSWPTWEIEGPKRLAYEVPAGAQFERREVELPGREGEPALFGEVLVPTEGKAPFPAVLWISGTGQEDRYGFAGPPPVDLGGHHITDALANAGFVVLRFDERGRGRSEAAPLSFDGQIEDARRAFRTLMVQEEVDPDRMVLVGHGESGVRALHIAVAHPREIAGVALLAVPGRPYREVFLHQAEAALEQLPPTMREQARKEQRRMLDAIEAGEDVPPELERQSKWIREMLKHNPERLVGNVKAPLWIAQGGKDFEVDPKADVAALVFAAKKNRIKHTVKRYPDLDHLFKLEPGVSSPQRYLASDRAVDVDFLADLTAWARKVAKKK